jgi:hypothetical protein
MKFEELEIGTRYYIDDNGTTGILLWGDPSFDQAGFQIDQTEHYYFEDEDGLVRFGNSDVFEYSIVELEN